jgi:hypothetical protein
MYKLLREEASFNYSRAVGAESLEQLREFKKGIHHGILVRNAEGKRPLGTPRRWWVDNTTKNLREIV